MHFSELEFLSPILILTTGPLLRMQKSCKEKTTGMGGAAMLEIMLGISTVVRGDTNCLVIIEEHTN